MVEDAIDRDPVKHMPVAADDGVRLEQGIERRLLGRLGDRLEQRVEGRSLRRR
jgi:hypothetical protein